MRLIKSAVAAAAIAGLTLSPVALAETRSGSAVPGVTTLAMQGMDDDDDGSPSGVFLGVAALAVILGGVLVAAGGDDDDDDFDNPDTFG